MRAPRIAGRTYSDSMSVRASNGLPYVAEPLLEIGNIGISIPATAAWPRPASTPRKATTCGMLTRMVNVPACGLLRAMRAANRARPDCGERTGQHRLPRADPVRFLGDHSSRPGTRSDWPLDEPRGGGAFTISGPPVATVVLPFRSNKQPNVSLSFAQSSRGTRKMLQCSKQFV
jgi:hypothetical protein